MDQESGAILEEARVTTTSASFQRILTGLAPHLVVLESGTHTPWVARLVRQLGHELIIANPTKVRAIAASRRKTDERDARFLAQLGRVDPELLAPVYPREEEAQRALSVVRARDGLVQTRTKLINQMRGMVKAFGERLPAASSKSFARRVQDDLPAGLKAALEPLLRVVTLVNEEIARFDQDIEALAEKWPVTRRLRQIRGVGALTALVFVLIVGDPQRFPRSRAVSPYIGLVPDVRNSGKSAPQLPISKQGDPLLRRLLVQAAHYILGRHGQDSNLKRFGLKIAERGGKSGKKRAVVAVARKLAVLLHRLWVSGADYIPLYGAAAA
jgi:transposase